MPVDTPLIIGGRALALHRSWSAADVGIDAVNMKSITANTGSIIEVYGFKHFHIRVKQVITGTSTVGAAILKLACLAEDRTTLLFAEQTILTAIDIINAAATLNAHLFFSTIGHIAETGLIVSDLTAPTNAVDLRFLKCAGLIRLKLDVTTASDATTHTGSVEVRAST